MRIFIFHKWKKAYNSAKEMLNQILPLLPKINSVADVGCGVGTWLKTWQDKNNEIKILGIDGNSVDEKLFYIDKKNYKQTNLTSNYKDILKQLDLIDGSRYKPFDLVQSLEVAEHLEEKYARNFIQLLTSLSDIVLFSAAIPHQGGTDHFNEQPPVYWADIFKEFDYVCFDILREKIWNNEKIAFWYRQNTMLYAHKSKSYIFENLGFKPTQSPLHLVRPEYMNFLNKLQNELNNEKSKKSILNIFKFYLRHPKRMFINKRYF
ncbi:TPA: class I SAM-dependent methyltransferase [Campylobacter coli]|nr:class I SAM-dependent methyltransferase [Campylobacter coli]